MTEPITTEPITEDELNEWASTWKSIGGPIGNATVGTDILLRLIAEVRRLRDENEEWQANAEPIAQTKILMECCAGLIGDDFPRLIALGKAVEEMPIDSALSKESFFDDNDAPCYGWCFTDPIDGPSNGYHETPIKALQAAKEQK